MKAIFPQKGLWGGSVAAATVIAIVGVRVTEGNGVNGSCGSGEAVMLETGGNFVEVEFCSPSVLTWAVARVGIISSGAEDDFTDLPIKKRPATNINSKDPAKAHTRRMPLCKLCLSGKETGIPTSSAYCPKSGIR
jgi:hypothetical protein